MSGLGAWIWGTSQLDDAIDKATSELLPVGSEDIALNLEICDQIRSKSAPAKDAMRALKRRLNHKNPNVQLLTLSLTDICVKNGGDLFLNEVASREFMDNLVSILKMPALNVDVKNTILRLIQNWSIAFEGKPSLSYVGSVYKMLKNEGFKFPPKDLALANSAMIDTQTAPEWIDSDVCLRCRTSFTFTNRKHHCRNCGGVFDQQCSSKSMPLPHFGITQDVRVCDGCYNKLTRKGERAKKEPRSPTKDTSASKHSSSRTNRTTTQDLEDAELQRAIQLSLQESQNMRSGYVPSEPSPTKWQISEPPIVDRSTYPSKQVEDEEDDPDLRAAIEASLREANAPRPSAPVVETPRYEEPQYAPSLPPVPSVPNHDLDPLETDAILTFNQTVEQVEASGGRDLSRYPAVTELYDKASSLRPKLALSLDDTTRKQEMLSEMHNKLSEAVKLYDQILTQQVSQPRYRSSIASPSAPYQASANAYYTAGYANAQWATPQVQPQSTGYSVTPVERASSSQWNQPQAASYGQSSHQYAPSAPPTTQHAPPTAQPSLPPVTFGPHTVQSPPPVSVPQSPPAQHAYAPPAPVLSPPPPPQQHSPNLARHNTVSHRSVPAQNPQLARSNTISAPSQPAQRYHHHHQQQQQYHQDHASQLLASAPAPPTTYFPSAPTSVPQFEQQEERKEALLIDL
ncbi:vacuolar protein sorting-associated protein 27 [Coprinopsis cinerea okayama7|uniref:Vacuolar protein sorting-associated protein 27 n=1 Tax=Coprinopsis cinerea (strain Okayama-7 / 130 / ATCC MYA-4618 / FGSC 9003) TaxID=240176 RepID=A8N0W6_COPC7|nr:vacuolar protein sorting-associated protein 27 [Coprinopsis cinerea okayama7\|eukprot:XP_001828515.2 vacuolar protein sorting-associated protein 27 [Coprinopsis cinerea okayama7\